MEKTELAIIIVVAVVVFASVVYFAMRNSKPSETLVENSLLVKSGDPLGDIQKRIPNYRALVEDRLYNTNDSRNSAIAIMTSEIARGMALQGKNVTVYAIVQGGKNLCEGTNCTGAQVVVSVGACDCVYFNPTQVVVEGDANFLMNQSVRVGRLFGFALYKAK